MTSLSIQFGKWLHRCMLDGQAAQMIEGWEKDNGMLFTAIPELEAADGLEGGDYHGETVLEHLISTLSAASGYHPTLQLACFLHDVGKPAMVKTQGGSVTFHNHEVVGAELASRICKNLGYTLSVCQKVYSLVRHHMFHFTDETTDGTLRHWLLEVGPQWDWLLLLRLADRRGNRGKDNRAAWTAAMNSLYQRITEIIRRSPVTFAEDLALDQQSIRKLLHDKSQLPLVTSCLVGLTNQDPDKNTSEWLTNYINRIYNERT